MSTVDHIEALKAKHASLEHAIDQENTRPHPDDDAICSLKKRKLQIKDEIARLTASSTDTDALSPGRPIGPGPPRRRPRTGRA